MGLTPDAAARANCRADAFARQPFPLCNNPGEEIAARAALRYNFRSLEPLNPLRENFREHAPVQASYDATIAPLLTSA